MHVTSEMDGHSGHWSTDGHLTQRLRDWEFMCSLRDNLYTVLTSLRDEKGNAYVRGYTQLSHVDSRSSIRILQWISKGCFSWSI